jgi:hypothetical protein
MIRIDRMIERVRSFEDASDNIGLKLDAHDPQYPAKAQSLKEAYDHLQGVTWLLSGFEEPLREVVDKPVAAQEALYSLD